MARLHGQEYTEAQICELYGNLKKRLVELSTPDTKAGVKESIKTIEESDPCEDQKIMEVLFGPDPGIGLSLTKLNSLVDWLSKVDALTDDIANWVMLFSRDLNRAHLSTKKVEPLVKEIPSGVAS